MKFQFSGYRRSKRSYIQRTFHYIFAIAQPYKLISSINDKIKLIIFLQKHGNTLEKLENTLLTIYIQWKQCQTLLQTV